MRRTRAWWSRLTADERRELRELERDRKDTRWRLMATYGGPCYHCRAHVDYVRDLCDECSGRLHVLIAKANGDAGGANA